MGTDTAEEMLAESQYQHETTLSEAVHSGYSRRGDNEAAREEPMTIRDITGTPVPPYLHEGRQAWDTVSGKAPQGDVHE